MASDPLSTPTHKARTFLLGLSAAGFLTHFYGLTVEDVPLAGLKVNMTDNLVPLALTIGVGYFLASFIVYAVDDVINLTTTPFQERIASTFAKQTDVIRRDTIDALEAALRANELSDFDKSGLRVKAEEIWDRAFQLFELNDEQFKRTAGSMLQLDFHIVPHGSTSEKHFFAAISYMDALKSLERARLAVNYHRDLGRAGLSRRYSWYRRFRVWIFDLALPPLVGIATLVVMWWHLVPL